MPTQHDLIRAVRSLVKAYPDATYPGFIKPVNGMKDCMYGHGEASNGRCGCAVGQALIDIEIEINPIWDNFENESLGSISASHVCKNIWGNEVSVISDESLWLDSFQSEQDNDKTWLTALNLADGEFPSIRLIE